MAAGNVSTRLSHLELGLRSALRCFNDGTNERWRWLSPPRASARKIIYVSDVYDVNPGLTCCSCVTLLGFGSHFRGNSRRSSRGRLATIPGCSRQFSASSWQSRGSFPRHSRGGSRSSLGAISPTSRGSFAEVPQSRSRKSDQMLCAMGARSGVALRGLRKRR